jgi:hypothetical protein
MERIDALINKLKEQASQNATPDQMLVTIQLLTAELQTMQAGKTQTLGTPKVAVMMPRSTPIVAMPTEHEKYFPKQAAEREPVSEKQVAHEPDVHKVKETILVENGAVSKVQKNGQLDMVFDPMVEIPTLSHQVKEKEINELMMEEPESLNDKLKHGKAELREVLKESPVRDLRKAIGINDRFLFINDLFRGDENMYERCIKTINSFNIYAEAEYWINRELKVKLGWTDDNKSTEHFYQLVKRRFS